MAARLPISKFTLSIFFAAILAIAASVWALQTRLETMAKNDVSKTLNSVLSNTEASLQAWERQQVAAIQFWPEDPRFLNAVEKLLTQQPLQDTLLADPGQEELRALLRGFLTDGGYQGYFVIAPDGTSLASFRDFNVGTPNLVFQQDKSAFERVMNGTALVTHPLISDLKLSYDGRREWKEPTLFAMTPVYRNNGDIIAVFTVRLNPAGSYAALFQGGRIGLTGETYAVDSSGRMVSESRFKDDLVRAGLLDRNISSSLNILVQQPAVKDGDNVLSQPALTLMASNVLNGNDGQNLEGYRNYKGTDVVGVWKWNDRYGVGLATEMNKQEAFASLQTSSFFMNVFAAISIIVLIVTLIISIRMRERMSRDAMELVHRRELMQQILDSAGEGVYGVDAQGLTTFINPMACKLLGYEPEDMIGKPLHLLIHHSYPDGNYYAKDDCYIHRSFKEGRSFTIREEVFWHKDGYSIPVWYTCTPLTQGDKIIGSVITFQDISEEREVRRRLEIAKEEAIASNKAKSTFLASMSHELRTPLNAILGFSQILRNEPKEMTADQRSFVSEIYKSGSHLLDLINEVLELSKIDAGELSLSIENVRPAAVIEDCISMVSSLASRNGIQIRYQESDDDLPIIVTDYLRFKQILINILSNAIKYNRDDGSVTITTKILEEGYLRIYVKDTGRGIPQSRMHDLWEPFNRIGAEASNIEGTGIGLSLCKRLIDLIGGRIGVESEIGVGSTFWFDQPTLLEKPHVKPSQLTKWQLDAEDHAIYDFSAFKGMKVLYVEDNPSNRALIQSVLHRETGVDLLMAVTGAEGMKVAIDQKPDMILLDINLPDFDGLAFKKRQISDKEISQIPVVALTANVSATTREKTEKLGFYEFLSKPLHIAQLYSCMKRIHIDMKTKRL
ncbi:hypothetical protein GCM10017044_28400 [Kordiimonas sediminis]|uniref:histidine kinase n=1 Tax=Kordiimonas sediminis TaxID=1735581 RepID=A0A919AY28_9PROT|nr:ATP-binding protein [Kordiimonas sediminis]GHF31242.1 hypothetical protein GCM10017044_28400 [Kordiimonas sediminis]